MQDRVRRLDDHHIDTRSHGLLRRRVAEVEHLVDHALLFVIELVVVGHDVADLLLGDVLAIRSALDAHRARDHIGRSRRQTHERRGDGRKRRQGAGHGACHLLRIGESEALRHQFAEDDARIGDDERDQDRSRHLGSRRKPVDAERGEP